MRNCPARNEGLPLPDGGGCCRDLGDERQPRRRGGSGRNARGAPGRLREVRMETRRGPFMPASLLGSQLAALEPLGRDEPGATIDATEPIEHIAELILQRARLA